MKSLTEIDDRIAVYEDLVNILINNNNLNQQEEFRKYLMILAENLQEMNKLSSYYSKDFTQTYNEREKTRNILVPNLLKVGNLLILSTKKVEKAKKKINELSMVLEDISDKKLLKYTQKILSKAYKIEGYSLVYTDITSFKKLKKKLKKVAKITENYGLTIELIKELEESGMAFMRCLVTINAIVKKRLKSMEQLKELSKQNEEILAYKIDKLVEIHEKPDTDFYIRYFQMREQTKEDERITYFSKFQLF